MGSMSAGNKRRRLGRAAKASVVSGTTGKVRYVLHFHFGCYEPSLLPVKAVPTSGERAELRQPVAKGPMRTVETSTRERVPARG
jgi:hypothetical protein